tara:strand:+ start:288 stop:1772 length:1485 start_codon:yes stop_codon:yes gene_type:complete
MSNRIIKIDSNQGSFDTTQSKSIVDLDIPANIGNINLSKSYVLVTMQPSAFMTDDKVGSVKNPYIKYNLDNGTDLHISDTASLVRNANFSSRKGRIEDIRHVDILKNTLSAYNKDLAEVQSGQNKLSTLEISQRFPAHQNNEISKVLDIPSRQTDHDIHIPLSSIFNSCKSEGFDTSIGAHGQSRVHLEMNFSKLDAAINEGFATKKIPGTTSNYATSWASQVAPAGGGIDITTCSGLGSAIYANNTDVPYFVGMAVNVTGTNDTTAIDVQKFITKVELSDAGLLTLTFDSAVATTPATKTFSFTSVSPNTTLNATRSVAIKKVQLVAELSDESPPASLNYTTYSSEEDTYPVSANVNRMYTLPPATKNVYIMFFGDQSSNKALSVATNLDNYRITIDNKEISPRSIKLKGRQHLDIIASVYANNGNVLKNVRERQLANVASTTTPTNLVGVANTMIAVPIPFKASNTLLQVELNGSGNMSGHHIVYSEVAKQM